MKYKIFVIYNTNLEKLRKTLDSIVDQEEDVVVFNNTSENIPPDLRNKVAEIMALVPLSLSQLMNNIFTMSVNSELDYIVVLDDECSINEKGSITKFVKSIESVFEDNAKLGALLCDSELGLDESYHIACFPYSIFKSIRFDDNFTGKYAYRDFYRQLQSKGFDGESADVSFTYTGILEPEKDSEYQAIIKKHCEELYIYKWGNL